MVETQIVRRGVRDARVLAALRRVPRHRFVRDIDIDAAYGDHPIDIGFGQTISQPYIVAAMSEMLALDPQSRVLEIGTGSAYQTAVLAELACEVHSIEIIPQHADRARSLLHDLGYDKVSIRVGDGYLGWPDAAPFDAVIAAAAPDHVPPPLLAQLAVGGRMVIPIGTESNISFVSRVVLKGMTRSGISPSASCPCCAPAAPESRWSQQGQEAGSRSKAGAEDTPFARPPW